jgi:hypothetical protein
VDRRSGSPRLPSGNPRLPKAPPPNFIRGLGDRMFKTVRTRKPPSPAKPLPMPPR